MESGGREYRWPEWRVEEESKSGLSGAWARSTCTNGLLRPFQCGCQL